MLCYQAKALTPLCSAAGGYRKRAEDEYLDKFPNNLVELYFVDHTRRSMYKELQKDYDRKLSWAHSLGIGTEPLVRFILVS